MKTSVYPYAPACIFPNENNKLLFPMAQHTYMRLDGVIRLIKEAIPLSYIFYTNLSDSGTDLILVTDRYLYKPADEVCSVLNLALLGYQHVNCTVYMYANVYDHLMRGHLYFSAVCRPENCLYQRNENFDLPLLYPEQANGLIQAASSSFHLNLHKAFVFYQGAGSFHKSNEVNMAAFMLQQACELCYRSLLLAFRGKELRCHELVVLRKHVLHLLPELRGIFGPDEKKETTLLMQMQEAYIRSRYDNSYEADTEKLLEWLEKTSRLLQQSHQVFNMYCSRIHTLASTRSESKTCFNDETIS